MSTQDSSTFGKQMEADFSAYMRSTEAFVAIDYDFNFPYVNNAAAKFYKKSKTELIGRKIEGVFPDIWEFGPFKNARKNVVARKHFEMTYHSPFTDKRVLLTGAAIRKPLHLHVQ